MLFVWYAKEIPLKEWVTEAANEVRKRKDTDKARSDKPGITLNSWVPLLLGNSRSQGRSPLRRVVSS